MIKLNHIYGTKKDYFIVIIRNPRFELYELHFSRFLSYLQDFDYLLNEGIPLLTFYNLSSARYCARKIIDGAVSSEDFN